MSRIPLLPASLIALALISAAAPPGSNKPTIWDFEGGKTGQILPGFANEVGKWVVEADGKNLVLAQTAENDETTFNLALVAGTAATDLDLSVRLKAISGKNDQGGGLVWRAKDARNYYIARFNPLENNFRVYKVQDSKRTLFLGTKIPGNNDWHTLRVTMAGPKIACYLDGAKHLEVEDATFPEAGRIGLWTKADARTIFDDLALAPIEAKP